MLCPVCNAQNPDYADACRSCGSPLAVKASSPHVLKPGSKLLGGFYAVGKILGQGGFGITYLGSDVKQRMSVAIKEFFPQGSMRQGQSVFPVGNLDEAGYKEAKSRFIDEGATLKKFKHPGIVRVYALFEENNTAYMVMEYLRGDTLQNLVDKRGALPYLEAVGYILDAGEALAVVHRANLLHRDIKPENIIVTDTRRVVLIDFGSAKEFVAGKTQSHSLTLTPGYAPLEQYAQRAHRGAFTDVYALGATLYHLLTGQAPVAATDRASGVDFPSPYQLNPDIPIPVSDAVMRAMEMKVDQRPQSVTEFLAALRLPKPKSEPSQPKSAWRKESESEKTEPRRSPPPPIPNPPPYHAHHPPRQIPTARRMERIGILPLLSEFTSKAGVWIGAVAGALYGLSAGIPGFFIGGFIGLLAGGVLGIFLPYAALLALCIWPYLGDHPEQFIRHADSLPNGVMLFLGLLLLGLLPILQRPKS